VPSCLRSWSSASCAGRGSSSKPASGSAAPAPRSACSRSSTSFHDWFQQDDYEGCSFINVLLETGDREHPVGNASARYLENIRTIVRTLAEDARLRDPEAFALSWHLLMKGAIVQAAEGDRQAAQRAKTIARLLLEQRR
jgi:hypothetical protein